jgi:hypothetical protein
MGQLVYCYAEGLAGGGKDARIFAAAGNTQKDFAAGKEV